MCPRLDWPRQFVIICGSKFPLSFFSAAENPVSFEYHRLKGIINERKKEETRGWFVGFRTQRKCKAM